MLFIVCISPSISIITLVCSSPITCWRPLEAAFSIQCEGIDPCGVPRPTQCLMGKINSITPPKASDTKLSNARHKLTFAHGIRRYLKINWIENHDCPTHWCAGMSLVSVSGVDPQQTNCHFGMQILQERQVRQTQFDVLFKSHIGTNGSNSSLLVTLPFDASLRYEQGHLPFFHLHLLSLYTAHLPSTLCLTL